MNLVICGNGFDLHHNLDTSYKEYAEYLANNAPHVLEKFISFPWLNAQCEDNLWNDVERTLSVDFEGMYFQLKKYVADYLNGDEKAITELQTDFEEWCRFIYLFTGEEFYKWLTDVDVSLAEVDPSLVDVIVGSVCVNFNYTDVLESVYEVSPEKVLHIHGALRDVRVNECMSNTIIPPFCNIEEAESCASCVVESDKWNSDVVRDEVQFGAPVVDDLSRSIRAKVSTINDESIVEIIQTFAEKTVKYLPKNISALEDFLFDCDITDVHVMGLSLPGVDDYYFEKLLFPKYTRCIWHFYYHGDKDEDAEIDRQSKERYAMEHNVEKILYHRW